MTLLVDDQLLSSILRGEGRIDQLPAVKTIYTTGYWYVRLCQAALDVADRSGILSGPFASLPPSRREQALAAVLELPEEIGLVSLRQLAPVIARLRPRHQLNILGMEALAAALHLKATVALSSTSPGLEAALKAKSIPLEILE